MLNGHTTDKLCHHGIHQHEEDETCLGDSRLSVGINCVLRCNSPFTSYLFGAIGARKRQGISNPTVDKGSLILIVVSMLQCGKERVPLFLFRYNRYRVAYEEGNLRFDAT